VRTVGRREAPVPDGPLHDFAQGLRDLRATRAPSTYRELAKSARYSASVLSTAAAGRRLPTLDVTLAFVTACGGDVDAWRERWERLHVTLRNTRPDLLSETVPADLPESDVEPLPTAAVLPLTRNDPTRIGPYRLLGRIGAGAMAVVYLGAARSGRPVAVKVVHAHLAEDAMFRRRFAAEVAAARRVRGTYTPEVVDADPQADRPWMASGYVPGPPLGEVVETSAALPAPAVRGLAAGVAQALLCIHGAGVLHRDLKPANVLLAADGPKVIDFGVARATDESHLTRTGERVGTAPFMAPEQADGRAVTGAADVFALGSLVAYAASGTPPFGDGATGQVLYRIVHTDPDPAALAPLDDDLRDLVIRCLDKDPAKRPHPAEIVAECAADQPHPGWLPTEPNTRADRRQVDVAGLVRQQATRRRRAILRAAAAAVAAVVLVVGGVVGANLLLNHPAPPATSPYALVYQDRRLDLPNYHLYIDLIAGTVVEGFGDWTMSTNSGGDGKGAFELPDNTVAFVPDRKDPLTADQCAAGLAARSSADDVHFGRVPPGHWFCLRAPRTGDLALIKVIDTDSGNYAAKVAVDYYQQQLPGR